MFATEFPQYSYLTTDWFVRSLRQFYQNKGTADSIKWFFRAFFNEPADVHYPREDIFTASGGTWDAPFTIKVGEPTRGIDISTDTEWISPSVSGWSLDVQTWYIGQRVRTTTGEAIVEHVRTYTVGNGGNKTTIHELTLQYGSVGGTFTYGQELHNIDSDKQVYTEIQAVIQSIQVVNGGSGYAPGDEIGRAHV